MKKGFPHKILGIGYGWDNLGQIGSTYNGNDVITFRCHLFCKTRLKIGRENGILFQYCPKCMVKMIDIENEKS